MITCVSGVTIRTGTAEISEQGRATQGVKLIKLDENDEIAAITNLDEEQVKSTEDGNSNEPSDDNSKADEQNPSKSEDENPEIGQ
jgi:DNA gyrase subunit A